MLMPSRVGKYPSEMFFTRTSKVPQQLFAAVDAELRFQPHFVLFHIRQVNSYYNYCLAPSFMEFFNQTLLLTHVL
jgi:hypothetical protein